MAGDLPHLNKLRSFLVAGCVLMAGVVTMGAVTTSTFVSLMVYAAVSSLFAGECDWKPLLSLLSCIIKHGTVDILKMVAQNHSAYAPKCLTHNRKYLQVCFEIHMLLCF